MARVLFLFAILATQIVLADSTYGQDVLAAQKINGLKGLRSLAFVMRRDPAEREIVPSREWADIVQVRLNRDLPRLKLIDKAEIAPAWLELNIVTADQSGLLELSLYRWVTVSESGETIFTKVWWEKSVILGKGTSAFLKEGVDSLLTRFAADYLRAQR